VVADHSEGVQKRETRIRISTFYADGSAHQMYMRVNMPLFWEQVMGLVPPNGSVWIDAA
jgi:hypothetical protein